jgi:hypothetical protein
MNDNANDVFVGNRQFEQSPNFGTCDPSFAKVLALTARMSNARREACPPDWLELSALPPVLMEDDGMTTVLAAYEVSVPVWLVAGFRAQMGI